VEEVMAVLARSAEMVVAAVVMAVMKLSLVPSTGSNRGMNVAMMPAAMSVRIVPVGGW